MLAHASRLVAVLPGLLLPACSQLEQARLGVTTPTTDAAAEAGPTDAQPVVDARTEEGHGCGAFGEPCATSADCCTDTCEDWYCGDLPPACAQGPPVLMYQPGSEENGMGMAIDGLRVYWTAGPYGGVDGGHLNRISKSGGPAWTNNSYLMHGTEILVDSEYLYWTRGGDGSLGRLPKAVESVPDSVAWSGPSTCCGLGKYTSAVAQDAMFLYAAGPEGLGRRDRSWPDNAWIEILAALSQPPYVLAVDSSRLYWTTWEAPGLWAMPKQGGKVVMLAGGPGNGRSVAVDEDAVYWAWNCEAPKAPCGTVSRVPKSGEAPVVLAADEGHPDRVVVDTTHVYWTSRTQGDKPFDPKAAGLVRRAPKGGGPVETFATLASQAAGIAVDKACVYWLARDGKLYKAHK